MVLLCLLSERNGSVAPHQHSAFFRGATRVSALAMTFMWITLTAVVARAAEQFLITPVAVTSDSSVTDLFPAANLIDNSGLSPIPTLETYRAAQHDSASPSRSWATAAPRGVRDYFAGRTPDPVLTFTLPDLYQITHLVVWGFYYTSPNNSEASAFTLEFSSDGGATSQRITLS